MHAGAAFVAVFDFELATERARALAHAAHAEMSAALPILRQATAVVHDIDHERIVVALDADVDGRDEALPGVPGAGRAVAELRGIRPVGHLGPGVMVGARRPDDPLDVLSAREREVLSLMAEGRSNAGIARQLVVTGGTVEKHVRSILAKLNLPESDVDHRRVLAVITFLEAR